MGWPESGDEVKPRSPRRVFYSVKTQRRHTAQTASPGQTNGWMGWTEPGGHQACQQGTARASLSLTWRSVYVLDSLFLSVSLQGASRVAISVPYESKLENK